MTYDIIFFTDLVNKYHHSKPLGAYRLATELRKNGYTVKVIDYTTDWMTDFKLFFTLLDALVGSHTLFVGFSSTFYGTLNKENKDESYKSHLGSGTASKYPCHETKFELCLKHIHKKWPHVACVYGGAQANSEDYYSAQLDYVIPGLADNVIVDLANHLQKQTALKFNRLSGKQFKYLDYDVKGLN
jgi:hypothetical protein